MIPGSIAGVICSVPSIAGRRQSGSRRVESCARTNSMIQTADPSFFSGEKTGKKDCALDPWHGVMRLAWGYVRSGSFFSVDKTRQ